VVAVWQRHVFEVYSPILLGKSLKRPTYSATVNPGIDVIFMGAAMRYGHSAVPSSFLLIEDDGMPSSRGPIPFRDTYYNTNPVQKYGIEPFLRGLAVTPEGNVDAFISPELRRDFFNVRLDVGAMNIQRGRDLGLPTYNQARVLYGLAPVKSFLQVSSDPNVQVALEEMYKGDIDNVDLFVGGIAEDRNGKARVGPLFSAILTDQLIKIRDGDRYFFRASTSRYTKAEIEEITNFSFSQLVSLNTAISDFPLAALNLQAPYDAFGSSEMSKCKVHKSNPLQSISPKNGTWFGNYTVDANASFNITMDNEKVTIDFQLNYQQGYFGIGFSSSMVNSDMWIISISPTEITVLDYFTNSYLPVPDTDMGGTNDLEWAQRDSPAGVPGIRLSVSRALISDDSFDVNIFPNQTSAIFAFSTTSSIMGYHASNRGSRAIQANLKFFASANSSSNQTEIVPVSLTNTSVSVLWGEKLKVLHGVQMAAVFGVLLPLGIYTARYRNTVRVFTSSL
jgi:hypothetical protein